MIDSRTIIHFILISISDTWEQSFYILWIEWENHRLNFLVISVQEVNTAIQLFSFHKVQNSFREWIEYEKGNGTELLLKSSQLQIIISHGKTLPIFSNLVKSTSMLHKSHLHISFKWGFTFHIKVKFKNIFQNGWISWVLYQV